MADSPIHVPRQYSVHCRSRLIVACTPSLALGCVPIVKDTPAPVATDDLTALLVRDSIGGTQPRGRWRHLVTPWEGTRRIGGVEVAQATMGIGAITALGVSLPGFDQFLTWASRALQNSLLYEGIESGCASMHSSQQRQ